MTLEGSTLDVDISPAAAAFLTAAGSGTRPVASVPRRRTSARRSSFGETSDDSALDARGIDELPPYDVVGDERQLLQWAAERRLVRMLGVISAEVGRCFVAWRPVARLVEDVESDDKVIVVIARVALPPDRAIDALIEFTGTEWWARMVASTQGGIVVDVECV